LSGATLLVVLIFATSKSGLALGYISRRINMLDTFLKIASIPDWITPTISIIQTIWNRPSVGYNVSADTQWSTYSIRALLTDVGIKVWGVGLIDNMIIFRVRKAQASYTQYLLEREGIPYQGGSGKIINLSNKRKKEQARSEPTPKGWLDNCLDGINKFVDGL